MASLKKKLYTIILGLFILFGCILPINNFSEATPPKYVDDFSSKLTTGGWIINPENYGVSKDKTLRQNVVALFYPSDQDAWNAIYKVIRDMVLWLMIVYIIRAWASLLFSKKPENMQNTLASYYSDKEQLDVALCSNDSTALGVAQAISSDYKGKNTPIVTGQDGDIPNLKNIVDGKQSMTVYKNVSDEAAVTLEVSKAILAGQTPDAGLIGSLDVKVAFDTTTYSTGVKVVPSYLLDPYVITKDNLQLLVDTGLYKWDADKKYLESTAETTW